MLQKFNLGNLARDPSMAASPHRRCTPNAIAYNSALGACGRARSAETALELLKRMDRQQAPPGRHPTWAFFAMKNGDFAIKMMIWHDLAMKNDDLAIKHGDLGFNQN